MSEEETTGKGRGEILQELESLGDQLAEAIRSLWESEESRNLRQEIGEGFVEMGNQVDQAFKHAQESEAAKQFGEQVRATMGRARETEVVGSLESGLASGLRELNAQLSKLVESLQEDKPGGSDMGSGSDA